MGNDGLFVGEHGVGQICKLGHGWLLCEVNIANPVARLGI